MSVLSAVGVSRTVARSVEELSRQPVNNGHHTRRVEASRVARAEPQNCSESPTFPDNSGGVRRWLCLLLSFGGVEGAPVRSYPVQLCLVNGN